MTSSLLNKKSFILQFTLYFSVVLIVLGVIQATIGTIRLYNASEQEYEKLAPDTVYTIPEMTDPIVGKPVIQQTQKEIIYYAAEDKTTPNTPVSISLEKPQTPQIKKEIIESGKKLPEEKKITSPVEISVTPEKETAPKGYQDTIWTVVTGKYFRDTLWKFPIIIDTTRIEPR